MRCEEAAGFLMLRHCQNVAQFRCCHCGKSLCAEHVVPVQAPQAPEMPGGAEPQAGTAPAEGLVPGAAPIETAEYTGQPSTEPAVTPAGAAAEQAPLAMAAPGQVVSCPTCLKRLAEQQQYRPYYDTYFYHYPYYGSYRPYYWDYNDRDRGVFDRQTATQDAADDALGS